MEKLYMNPVHEVISLQSENTQLTIANQRLKKRIDKLTKQRDHYKEQLGYYQKVLSMQPFLESRYQTYLERKQERERVKGLEARVEEQAKLIQMLYDQAVKEGTGQVTG